MPLVAAAAANSDKEEVSEDVASIEEEEEEHDDAKVDEEEENEVDKPMNGGDSTEKKNQKKVPEEKPATKENNKQEDEKQSDDDEKKNGASPTISEKEGDDDDEKEEEEKKEGEKDDEDSDNDDDKEEEEEKDDVDNEEEEENSEDEVQKPPMAKKSPTSHSQPTAAVAAAVPAPEENPEDQSSTWKPQILPADFTPSPAHVLCGRRKGHKDFGGNWPGNLALEEVIAEHLSQYEAADLSERNEIIQKILDQVRRCKGGFVRISLLVDDDKNSQQRWMDVGDINARKDVAAIFRLFMQSRRLRKEQAQEGATNKALQQRSPQPMANPPPPPAPPKGTSPVATAEAPYAHLQNVARAQHMRNSAHPTIAPPTTLYALKNKEKMASPSLALPTKLYAVEKSGTGGDAQSKSTTLKKRTTAAMENSIPRPGLVMAAPNRMSTSIPGVPPPPVQFERPKKRRSVEENLAADALQLIAQAPSTADDESTTNSTPTVRRRSGINMPRPRPSIMESENGRKTHLSVCCLQLGQRQPSESPWDAVQRALACLTSVAQSEQVDLFILPELSPFGSSLDTFTKYLPLSTEWQHLYQRVDDAFAEHARILGAYIVYGTIGWFVRETDRSLRFKLSHKVVDRQGKIVAVHDKAYLSDLEFRFFDAGHRKTVTFHIDGFSFGLLVGDDLKYPNLARGLARDNDVDVIVNPSADSIPLYFRQCRAVENSIYVLGVEYSTGTTVACPPDPDHEPISMEAQDEDGDEGYLMTRIQRTALEYARTNFSHYRRMKTEVR